MKKLNLLEQSKSRKENKLVKIDNGIKLQSYTGTNLGSLEVISENLTVETTAEGNATKIALSLDWGTF